MDSTARQAIARDRILLILERGAQETRPIGRSVLWEKIRKMLPDYDLYRELLADLKDQRIIEERVIYGGKGRPPTFYRLTARGHQECQGIDRSQFEE